MKYCIISCEEKDTLQNDNLKDTKEKKEILCHHLSSQI